MEKVVLLTYDEVTKDFQVVQSLTSVCRDMYSASHFLTLTADRFHQRGNSLNNIKMKMVKVFESNS